MTFIILEIFHESHESTDILVICKLLSENQLPVGGTGSSQNIESKRRNDLVAEISHFFFFFVKVLVLLVWTKALLEGPSSFLAQTV